MFSKKLSYWFLALAINITLAILGAFAEVFIATACSSLIDIEVFTLILPLAFLLLFCFLLIRLNQIILDWRFRYERETPSDAMAFINAMIGIVVMGILISMFAKAGSELFT